MRRFIVCLFVVLMSVGAMADEVASVKLPEAPRVLVDTSIPAREGRTVTVSSGDDLQQALNDARPGDTLVLEAGATFTGSFTLRKKDGEGWITITSSAEALLPKPGVRATPDDAPHMPTLQTSRSIAALHTEPGASHYRLIGLEFTVAPLVKKVTAIVDLSGRSARMEDVPSHIVLDRVLIRGRPDLSSQRGLAMNARHAAIIDSWVDECHIHGFDSQAVCAWNAPGPLKIVNCFLEAGSENIMFGGARNRAESMVPSDIEIRRNHLYKNPEWVKLRYPHNWAVKNLFEIKTARRVLFEGNVLENCWAEAQTGFAFVLKSSSPSQGRPWDTTNDLTIRHNRVINVLNGFSIARWSSSGPVKPGAQPTSRILIEHNVFERLGIESDFGRTGSGSKLFQMSGADFTIRHNTAWTNVGCLAIHRGGIDGFSFTDNLVTPGSYFLHCDGGRGHGWEAALTTHLRGVARMEGNAVIRVGTERARKTRANMYPPDNHWFNSFEAAGVDREGYRSVEGSSLRGKASDGTNPGADIAAVMKATAGVRGKRP